MSFGRLAALATVASAALVLTACTALAPEPTPEPTSAASVTLTDETRATLQRLFDEGFAASGMPGAAAYVRIGDDEWTAVTGVSDLETQEPFEATDLVRIASNTKPFVATVVLQLIDEGQLTLDDVLESYVPGIPNGDIITVRDLLQMSSGVWDLTSDEPLMAMWADDLMMPWSVEDSIELMRQNPSRFEPGSKVLYTDSNYILLGEIAEIVSGTPLHELVQTKILDPLGLDDTRFPAPDQPDVPEPAAQGYRPPGEQLGSLDELIPVGDINPEVAWGAGNMTSTLADLAIWGDALADGTLLSPELQAQRLDTREFDGQKIEFGYGLGIINIGDFLGHDGAIVGYSTAVFRLPADDATFVIVGNASSNFTTPTMDIFLSMVKELYPEQLRPIE